MHQKIVHDYMAIGEDIVWHVPTTIFLVNRFDGKRRWGLIGKSMIPPKVLGLQNPALIYFRFKTTKVEGDKGRTADLYSSQDLSNRPFR